MTDNIIAFPATTHRGRVRSKEGSDVTHAAVIAFPPDAEDRFWWAFDAAETNCASSDHLGQMAG